MSTIEIFKNKLTLLTNTENILENEESIEEVIGFGEQNFPNLTKFITKLQGTNADQEKQYLDEFRLFNPDEKIVLRLMMSFIMKLGACEQAEDLDQRRHWLNLLNDN